MGPPWGHQTRDGVRVNFRAPEAEAAFVASDELWRIRYRAEVLAERDADQLCDDEVPDGGEPAPESRSKSAF